MNNYQKYLKYKIKYLDLKYKQNGGTKIIRKKLNNYLPTPWLDWIEQGLKKYDGRLNRGSWKNIEVGDVIVWSDVGRNESSNPNKGKIVETKVTKLKYYPNFVEAFRDLGQKMVPIKNITEEEVTAIYLKFFKKNDIKKYGAVAIGLKVIASQKA